MLGGLAALGLDDRLGGRSCWRSRPGLTGVVVAVGRLAAWVVLAIDGGEHAALAAVPPVLAGASLGVGLAVGLNPAAVMGLATAGLLSWTTAGIAAGAGLDRLGHGCLRDHAGHSAGLAPEVIQATVSRSAS